MYQYINFNNNLYIVRRTFKLSELKQDFDTNIMKQWTRTDVLLKKDGLLLWPSDTKKSVFDMYRYFKAYKVIARVAPISSN